MELSQRRGIIMYIDYSKIITDDFKLFITNEQLAEIKEIANKERIYLKGRYSKETLKVLLSKKANEAVYINSRHQLKNSVEKALIASNIVFDDEKMARILVSGKFDRDSLETFIKLLSYLKIKVSNDTIDENDQKYLTIADNYAKKLINHFTKYIGGCEIDIIINKINEIISFNPVLLETKQNKHTR